MNSAGQARPKAEGYPLAPLTEALLDVRFEKPLVEGEVERARKALSKYYSTFSPIPFHEFRVDADAGSVEVGVVRQHYRGLAKDTSEVSLLRPDGLATSQLAPYRDWTDLYGRFTRDLDAVFEAIGPRPLSRMAVRNINRIDVPPTGDMVRYEDYFTIYPNLPAELDPVLDFQVNIMRAYPEIAAVARILVRGHPRTLQDRASFVLDVDLFRTENVPNERKDLDSAFEEFRLVKNIIYKTCLTPLALKEFEQ